MKEIVYKKPRSQYQNQLSELKAAVINLQMQDDLTDELILKACQMCPNDNNSAINLLLSGEIHKID